MSSNPSLRSNFSWMLAGNAIYGACQWGFLILLTKMGTPEMVGWFALAQAICIPIILFSNLNLRAVQATDAKGEFAFGTYLALRLLTLVVSILGILVVCSIGNLESETVWVILALAVAKVLEATSDAFYGLFQRRERLDRIAQSTILRGLGLLAAAGVGLYFTNSLVWTLLGAGALWFLVLLFFDRRTGIRLLQPQAGSDGVVGSIRPRWNSRELRTLTWLALPLGIVALLASLYSHLPAYFLEAHWGARELGLFAAAAYLMRIGAMGVTALGQTASPRLASYYAGDQRAAFSSLLIRILALVGLIGLAGTVVAWAAGEEILTLLYRSEYGEMSDVLLWIMIAAAASYLSGPMGTAVTSMRLFRVQIVIQAVRVATMLALAPFWIPEYGALGAAWVLVAGGVASFLGYGITVTVKLARWRPAEDNCDTVVE